MAKNWKCVDCSKLIWNRYTRCHSCARRGTKNPNYGKGLFGKNNPNWRNGESKNGYTHKFKSRIRYLIVRKYPVCQWCGSKENLVAHHINHQKNDDGPFNLITLCRICNIKEFFQGKEMKELLLKYKTEVKFLI